MHRSSPCTHWDEAVWITALQRSKISLLCMSGMGKNRRWLCFMYSLLSIQAATWKANSSWRVLFFPFTAGSCLCSNKPRNVCDKGTNILQELTEGYLVNLSVKPQHQQPQTKGTRRFLLNRKKDKFWYWGCFLKKFWVNKVVLTESSQLWITYKKNKRDEHWRFFMAVNK